MPSYLSIHVHFLAGHYHGVEWPPSPMRLLQAIVAGGARAGTIGSAEATLTWLERQNPPRIHAPPTRSGTAFTAYVPRNSDDLTVLSHYKGVPLYEVQAKRRTRYDAQPTVRRWVAEPVVYEWEVEDELEARRVGALSQDLVCLGRAEDLAFARFEIAGQARASSSSTWRPAVPTPGAQRNLLRIPTHNSFASLVARERARRARNESREYVDPFIVYDEQGYECGTDSARRPILFYELRSATGEPLDWRHPDGVSVAAMLRHALRTRVPPELLGYAMGHIEAGDRDDRLSWVPLPSIEHLRSDGLIRRAMILGPTGEPHDSSRFREVRHALAHSPLLHRDSPIGALSEAEPGAGLRRYLASGTTWHTVTPLVTHGKTTRGGAARGKFSARKAEKLILHALSAAGLPRVAALRFQTAPFERACRAAGEYRVPAHLAGLSRFHVAVTFAESVVGPVLAGTGRHYGFGLFCREREPSEL